MDGGNLIFLYLLLVLILLFCINGPNATNRDLGAGQT
jgi:hypothetical protein